MDNETRVRTMVYDHGIITRVLYLVSNYTVAQFGKKDLILL